MPDTRTRHELATLVAADALTCGPAAFDHWATEIDATFGNLDGLLGHVSARWYTAFYASLDAQLESADPDLAALWDSLAEIHPGYRILLEAGVDHPVLLKNFAYQCDRVQQTTGIDMRTALAARYPRHLSTAVVSAPSRKWFHKVGSAADVACYFRRIGEHLHISRSPVDAQVPLASTAGEQL